MITRSINEDTLEIRDGNELIFTLSEKMDDDELHIDVVGEIRNEVAHEFEDELMAAFSVCNIIKLDLSKVTYIASIVLRTLLSVQQIIDENENASLVITGVSQEVKKIFDEAGFFDILIIEE